MAAWRGLLEQWVRERRPALIAHATLLTGERRQAEDLVHDAIVRSFARPRPSRSALGGMGRVAMGDVAADRLDVRTALRMPSWHQRMRFYDDMRVADIADFLALSDGAVKRYLSNGIHQRSPVPGTAVDPVAPDFPETDIVARRAGR